jgi:hypothetical protein
MIAEKAADMILEDARQRTHGGRASAVSQAAGEAFVA